MCDVCCVFVTFPRGILGQVWYLIVSIPDLCLLPYFFNVFCMLNYYNISLQIIKIYNIIYRSQNINKFTDKKGESKSRTGLEVIKLFLYFLVCYLQPCDILLGKS